MCCCNESSHVQRLLQLAGGVNKVVMFVIACVIEIAYGIVFQVSLMAGGGLRQPFESFHLFIPSTTDEQIE